MEQIGKAAERALRGATGRKDANKQEKVIDLKVLKDRAPELIRLLKKQKDVSGEVSDAFKKAAEGPMKGILAVSMEPLVSSDYNGDPHSSTVDAQSTNVIDGTLVHVSSWYDNEWGYSMRCVDLLNYIGKTL